HFRDPITDEHIIAADIHDAFGLVILRDCTPRRGDALGIRIALGFRQIGDHVLEDLAGRFETNWCRVADVESHNAMYGGLEALGLFQDGTAYVIADVE